ncbi:hypothetical protein AMTR_s00060p00096390 [Amborella trichopoda]|uniref:Uncharacterized protein n=1 Tax=Amborella trichopoda TaxID=13333 RepID=W1NJ88_AMBTC|nr:hypothetical protein AMTR_s00060p00096390 [Amborella trichopoda]
MEKSAKIQSTNRRSEAQKSHHGLLVWFDTSKAHFIEQLKRFVNAEVSRIHRDHGAVRDEIFSGNFCENLACRITVINGGVCVYKASLQEWVGTERWGFEDLGVELLCFNGFTG